MGNVSSRLDTQAALYVRDQYRLAFSSVSVTSSRKRSTVQLIPNAFPASRIMVSRPSGDCTPIDFVQDPHEPFNGPAQAPSFLLKLSSDDDLVFTFHFVVRQTEDGAQSPADTNIAGLTFVHASTPREVENLVTSEFNANPNLHKMPNVKLLGDYGTDGSKAVTFEWSWKWKPPKGMDERLAGWRNTCSFVEYDPRAHRLETLISFSFWVSNVIQPLSQPTSPTPLNLLAPPLGAPKLRLVSSQTVDSRMSSNEATDEPTSPLGTQFEVTPPSSSTTIQHQLHPVVSASLAAPVKIDVACPKPESDLDSNDGPVFRATMKALERKTGDMRTQMKRVLKKAEYAYTAQIEANEAFKAFIETLREASSTNANAVQPAIDHYFDRMAQEILKYEMRNTTNLKTSIIDPISKLYTSDIKQAEFKKRDFEDESKDYYAYVARYLGQRQDSVKAKKLVESDNKYQSKRKNFELKRFDYSSFMQDLHGGRKEQEVLSQLTRYAQTQTANFMETAKKIESLMPQLEALQSEVYQADKEYQLQRREREEKRRALEKGGPEAEAAFLSNSNFMPPPPSSNGQQSDSELNRADSTGSQLRGSLGPSAAAEAAGLASPASSSKFKGIRDLEDRGPMMASASSSPGQPGSLRKEGLVWALSRPNGHVDPRAALKQQGWHKFWLVLDQGKLQEYSNWKEKLDLHMEPVDLRTASVREARNAERRFCFEVITPNMRRVYQATSEEDMSSWITSINNALQSAMEGRGVRDMKPPTPAEPSSFKRDIGKILTGKTGSLHGHHNNQTFGSSAGIPTRRITVGARPSTARTTGSNYDESPDRLLQMLRDNDQGNNWCADCGSGTKVEWVSINLAIILCIECSGIHRSLGTHISKVRSLTLDITSFTPDIIELLMQVGNRVANMVWEAKLDPNMKPNPQATREQRLKFITAKYVNREFVTPISPTLSRYATADETLLAAVKKNDIQQVIYALALRANTNLGDRSRGTPVVFLAMAAADPAPPSPGLAPQTATESEKCTTFPVAEMLLQNGAEVPTTAPAFPLSRSAQLYIDAKRGRANLLSASNSDASPTPMLTSSTSTLEKMQRDKDARLQKRVSAGGRLAKSPIPEK